MGDLDERRRFGIRRGDVAGSTSTAERRGTRQRIGQRSAAVSGMECNTRRTYLQYMQTDTVTQHGTTRYHRINKRTLLQQMLSKSSEVVYLQQLKMIIRSVLAKIRDIFLNNFLRIHYVNPTYLVLIRST